MVASILFIMLGQKLDMGQAYYILICVYFMVRCLASVARSVLKDRDD